MAELERLVVSMETRIVGYERASMRPLTDEQRKEMERRASVVFCSVANRFWFTSLTAD